MSAAAAADGNGPPDWEPVAARLAAELREGDQVPYVDLSRDGVRAVVLMPDGVGGARRGDVRRRRHGRARRARRERARPRRGRRAPGPARGRAGGGDRRHAAPGRRRGGLRRARRVQVPRPPAPRGRAARPPLDRGVGAARPRRAAAAPRCSTRWRSTSRAAAPWPRRRAPSSSTRTRCASGSPGSSASPACGSTRRTCWRSSSRSSSSGWTRRVAPARQMPSGA